MGWDTSSAEEIITNVQAAKAKIEADHKQQLGLWQVVHHIGYKVQTRELKPEVAEKMLRAVEAGEEPDYRKLYLAAVRVAPGKVAYHSAPSLLRAQIVAEGLRAALPSDSHWNINAAGQPKAVYLAPEPDEIGKWATTKQWDVWEVETNGLTWQHDQMNEGCWAVLGDIPADKIHLFATYPG